MQEYHVHLLATSSTTKLEDIDQLHQDLEKRGNGSMNTCGLSWDTERGCVVFDIWLDDRSPGEALETALACVPIPVADDWRITCPS